MSYYVIQLIKIDNNYFLTKKMPRIHEKNAGSLSFGKGDYLKLFRV